MKSRLYLMMQVLFGLLAAAVAINYFVNPYGAWRVNFIDDLNRRIYRERVAVPYLIRTAQPRTLLLGTSRVLIGMRIEQGYRDATLNAALSGATLDEIAELLKIALGNPRLRTIVWGVDFFEFDRRQRNAYDEATRARMKRQASALVTDTLLSMDALGSSREELGRALRGSTANTPTANAAIPWPPVLIANELGKFQRKGLDRLPENELGFQLAHDLPDYASFRLSARQIALFRKSASSARRPGVRLILFMPPLNQYELEMIRQTGRWKAFMRWKRELAMVTQVLDFSGYNELARTPRLFLDVMHFKPAVGQILLRLMLGDGCSQCGYEAPVIAAAATALDEASVAAALALQESAMKSASAQETRFSEAVARALAGRVDH